jgi:ABC-type thiamine transport system, ATPase component
MLVIENCRLSWPDFTADYSLRVKEGTFCAVIGPSGGGKTTLLHMISGFETPQSGTLTFGGRDLLPLVPSERPVAIVFQDHNLFPHLSAAENVALGIRPSLRLSREERDQVSDILNAVDLKGFEGRRPGEMSGGQRQRVALARALVSGRPLVLLDEPFSSLDPQLRHTMMALVDTLRRRRNVTVIMSIHTPEDVRDTAEQMVLVAQGRVVLSGPPAAVLQDPVTRSVSSTLEP